MTDEYWFWLTVPGGVVIGLIIFGPFIAAYFFWQWYKADKEKRERAKRYDEYMERLRRDRGGGEDARKTN